MDFIYSNYALILQELASSGKYMDYSMIDEHVKDFIVLRHDIEFSIGKAVIMSEIEKAYGVASSYFVQIQNNFYNALSYENIKLLNSIYKNNHYIGLHYHLDNSAPFDYDTVCSDIRKQCDFLSCVLDIPITRFSIHKPTNVVLKHNLTISGLINTYDPLFFSYVPNPEKISCEKLNVKYFADSRIQWKYGIPTIDNLRKYEKIQLLIHPYSWDNMNHSYNEILEITMRNKMYEALETYVEEQK